MKIRKKIILPALIATLFLTVNNGFADTNIANGTENMPNNLQMTEKTANELNMKYLTYFNEAIDKGSINSFYEKISPTWKAKVTPAKMQEAFKPIFDNHIDFSEAINNPNSKSKIIQDGEKTRVNTELKVKGEIFDLDCAYKLINGKYELVGFRVGLKSETSSYPVEQGAILNKQALTLFNLAIKNNDITPFYNSISPIWKEQISAEEMRRTFDVFFKLHLDFSESLSAFPSKANIWHDSLKTNIETTVTAKDSNQKKHNIKLVGVYVQDSSTYQLVGFKLTEIQ